MFSCGKKCLKSYISGLCLLVLVLLIYQTYSVVMTHYCQLNNCELKVFDRDTMCRNTNTSVRHGCSDPSCQERLSATSHYNFSKCFNKSWPHVVDTRHAHPGCCHFMSGAGGRRPVVLASYPGSGNTWVRGLLERITGICTGSVYCDVIMRRNGFIGESVTGPEVLVVKAHKKEHWTWNKPTIYVIRDPANAIVSHWNYKSTATHQKIEPLIMFGNYTGWERFFPTACNSWHRSVLKWSNSPTPLLIVSYEALVKDAPREVARMMRFLKLPFEPNDLRERLNHDYETFHRPTHRGQTYYTPQQKQALLRMLTDVHQTLKEKQKTRQLASIVHSYITSDTLKHVKLERAPASV